MTQPTSPTIVVTESRMHSPIDIRASVTVSKRYVWICLFLVVLLLYNPYLMAPGSAGGLNVRHPVSNRATVGSSELQYFASGTGQDFSGFADLAPAEVSFLLPALSELNFSRVSRRLSPPQRFLCASLWFRPPPAS